MDGSPYSRPDGQNRNVVLTLCGARIHIECGTAPADGLPALSPRPWNEWWLENAVLHFAMRTPSIKSVTDLRATLEGFASRHAASRVSAGASPHRLLDGFGRMQQVTESNDHGQFAAADRDLHQSIIELAGVPGLKDAWQAVFGEQDAFRIQTIRDCWPDLSVLFESHRPLVDAIAAGQPDQAEDAAIAHLDAVWYRLADATDDQPLPRDPLSRACAYLAFHFHHAVHLPQLAEEIAGCSSGHLARRFREEIGLGFSDYLIELRLQKAVQLLQRSNRTIQHVASQVGYTDPSRFATHFRRRFGKTPSAFREKYSDSRLIRPVGTASS